MTDTERLDAIIKEVQHKLGHGWWHSAMCEIHRASYLNNRYSARDIIDAVLSPPPSQDSTKE
jgi:hypothetical protein